MQICADASMTLISSYLRLYTFAKGRCLDITFSLGTYAPSDVHLGRSPLTVPGNYNRAVHPSTIRDATAGYVLRGRAG
jgi:hypothetical protein